MKTTRRNFLQATTTNVLLSALSANVFAAETVSPKIKIGQLGTGHAHAYKTGTLRKLTDCFEFIAVAEDNPQQRKNAEKQTLYKNVPWMSSEELLAIPELQAVAVETNEHNSLEAAKRCINAGKHIHFDKPAGNTITELAEFKKLLDEAETKKLVVQMGYMLRSNPAIQFTVNAVKNGLLGNIFDMDAAMSRYDNETARKRISGFAGGIPFLLACHLVDLAVILLGEPDKIHSFMKQTQQDGCIDNGLFVFEYKNGSMATLRSSASEVEGFQKRYLTVRGEKGTIIVQPLENKSNMSGGTVQLALLKNTDKFKKGYQTVTMPPLKDRYEDQWREFAAVINGSITNPYSYQHDYIVQKCLLEACGLK
ncbi:MAG: Gfo/Idh/MocA family oxidoreductase [Planctomycetaceae bacterium]|jgi:predicted dehydrogenase|nr:Gfo/Idh/MocA family oxidoreductase [Planctomycetaceae bacterium]